jgi:hypothetical protein
MSNTRLSNDRCEQIKRNYQRITPGNYIVKYPVQNGAVYQANPSIILQKTGVSLNSGVAWAPFNRGPVDIESDLFGIDRSQSRCPSGKYIPSCVCCGEISQNVNSLKVANICAKCQTNQTCIDSKMVDFPEINFDVESTRLNDCPPRGIGINRFTPLCLNAEANLFFPKPYQIPTRQVVKDNHRPCVRVPKVNSMHP